jgi:hypothetical protein
MLLLLVANPANPTDVFYIKICMVGRAAPAPDQLTGIEAAFGGRDARACPARRNGVRYIANDLQAPVDVEEFVVPNGRLTCESRKANPNAKPGRR